ncbi:hypothetical protein HTS88_16220 [Pseudarthrobacter oxydans]|nr:hypothetical protein [Pseudarthrobacter oxydans]
MRRFQGLPGASTAVGAFLLTVLLGFGGSAASALWHQSATATMTVTAAASWPGSAFQQFACARMDNADKAVALNYVLPEVPLALTLSAKRPDGTYGQPYTVAGAGASGSIILNESSPIIAENRTMSLLTVRATATYQNRTEASAEIVLRLDVGTNNGKLYCV